MKIEVPVDEAYRLINPGCVTLITSAYRERYNVMALAWQTPLSRKPPLLGIAVAQAHFTSELINSSGEFAVNIPGAGILKQVTFCGQNSGRDKDKFKLAGLTPTKAKKIRAPLIDECLASLECGVVERFQTGDHFFFVGEIVAADADKDFFFNGAWNEQAQIIHHLGGKLFYNRNRNLEFKD
jgi:flavin reductase (DIM6/NTAB) family NADH-FMN oxidoreductase RutF